MEPTSGVGYASSGRTRCSLRRRSASHRSYQQGRGRGVVLPEGLLVMYVFSEERTARGFGATRWRRRKSCASPVSFVGFRKLEKGDQLEGIGRQEMVAYADKSKQDQHQEEGEENIDWSCFDPGPERRRKLQQRCRNVHFLVLALA